MKHLSAILCGVVALVFAGVLLVANRHSPPTSILIAIAGLCVIAFGLIAPADLGQALNAAAPVLNRLPLPDVARSAVVNRVSQSVKLSDIKVEGP